MTRVSTFCTTCLIGISSLIAQGFAFLYPIGNPSTLPPEQYPYQHFPQDSAGIRMTC